MIAILNAIIGLFDKKAVRFNNSWRIVPKIFGALWEESSAIVRVVAWDSYYRLIVTSPAATIVDVDNIDLVYGTCEVTFRMTVGNQWQEFKTTGEISYMMNTVSPKVKPEVLNKSLSIQVISRYIDLKVLEYFGKADKFPVHRAVRDVYPHVPVNNNGAEGYYLRPSRLPLNGELYFSIEPEEYAAICLESQLNRPFRGVIAGDVYGMDAITLPDDWDVVYFSYFETVVANHTTKKAYALVTVGQYRIGTEEEAKTSVVLGDWDIGTDIEQMGEGVLTWPDDRAQVEEPENETEGNYCEPKTHVFNCGEFSVTVDVMALPEGQEVSDRIWLNVVNGELQLSMLPRQTSNGKLMTINRLITGLKVSDIVYVGEQTQNPARVPDEVTVVDSGWRYNKVYRSGPEFGVLNHSQVIRPPRGGKHVLLLTYIVKPLNDEPYHDMRLVAADSAVRNGSQNRPNRSGKTSRRRGTGKRK